MLNDLDDDDDMDQQMVLAATQVEQTYKKTALTKKNGKGIPAQLTFQNRSFSNIGTLNIHIHKN